MGYNILVVDDEWKAIEGMLRYFKFEGHKAIVAQNGEEALGILKNQNIDYMVLDIDMPGMTGDQVIDQINNDPKLKEKKIPIAICTSVLDREKVLEGKPAYLIEAIKSGEYPLFTKPVLSSEVLMKIKDTLMSRQEREKAITGYGGRWGELSLEESKEYDQLGWKLYRKYGDQERWDKNDPDFKRFDELSGKK